MRMRILGSLSVFLALAALCGSPARGQGTWADEGSGLAGTNGVPNLVGSGALTAGSPITLSLTNAKADSQTILLVSDSSIPRGFHGGVILAYPALAVFFISLGPSGAISLSDAWPAGFPPGAQLYFQYLIKDNGAAQGWALSNAARAVTQGPDDQFLYLSGKYAHDPDFGGNTNDPIQFDAVTIAADAPGEITNWLAKVTGDTLYTQWAMHVWEAGSSAESDDGPFVAVDPSTQDVYVSAHIAAVIGSEVRFYDATSPSAVASHATDNDNECYLLKYSKDGVFQWMRYLRADPIANPFATPRVMSTRRNLVVLPSGNVVMAVNVRVNGGSGEPTTLLLGGGVSEEVVAGFLGTSGGGPVQSAILEVDPSGAFVSAKRSEILEPAANSGFNCATIIARNTDSGLYVMHIQGDCEMRLGQGEANEFSAGRIHPLFEGDVFARPNVVKYDLSKLLQWTADTRFVNGGYDAGGAPLDIAVDGTGAVYQVGMRKDPTTPDAIFVRSADWSSPTVVIPQDIQAFVERPYYAKHDAAGVAQWVRGYGDSSIYSGGFETRPIGSVVVDDADQPWIAGMMRAGDSIVLDEGLGSQVTLDAGAGDLPRVFLARLNPADGTVAAVVTFNATGAGTNVFTHNEIAAQGNGDFETRGTFSMCQMVPSMVAIGLDSIRASLVVGATTLTPPATKGAAVLAVTSTAGAVLVTRQFPTGGQSLGTDLRILSVTPGKL